jgi:glycosyltransferase involved in cell wall biosynthesis
MKEPPTHPFLLSLCIPTFNRANALALLLQNLESEVAPFMDRVEVLVADNASTDRTPEVIASRSSFVRGLRSGQNTGGTRNYLNVIEAARGEFVWVIGDDDMILRGGLGRVLAALEAHPDLDVHYVNFGWIPVDKRNDLIQNHDSSYEILDGEAQLAISQSLLLDDSEAIFKLPARNVWGIFNGIFCVVIRRHLFLHHAQDLTTQSIHNPASPRLDDLFPHSKVTLEVMRGRPINVIAKPCLLQGTGAWEWRPYTIHMHALPIQELLQHLESIGYSQETLKIIRDSFAAYCGKQFARLLANREHYHGLEALVRDLLPNLATEILFWESFRLHINRVIHDEYQTALHNYCRSFLEGVLQTSRGPIAIWGAGGVAQALLRYTDLKDKVMLWVDADPAQHGTTPVPGGPMIRPVEELHEHHVDAVILADALNNDQARQLIPLIRRRPTTVIWGSGMQWLT